LPLLKMKLLLPLSLSLSVNLVDAVMRITGNHY
jgi:hypothetical protein